MIRIIADNILSPLGETTAANLEAVRRGESALREHHLEGMPESFVGSLLEPSLDFAEGLIRCISSALEEAERQGEPVNLQSPDVVMILSSTKGNIAHFERLGVSAQQVARHFGHPNQPIVVSNACISGLSALILAMRLLRTGLYRKAVVAGMDVQGKFIVSGFQSFKALSPEPCRPFDGDRCGLNLGEAAACMILSSEPGEKGWCLEAGAVRNDACHISNPSRTGEGALRAIRQTLPADVQPVCICAHGTATLYNDEMEACAIDRAGLGEVPTFSLKGYYGHTMGAAGLLESILTLHAVGDGWIPATRGYAEEGTSHPLHVTAHEESCNGGKVLKLLSGFGGCNAAVLFAPADGTATSDIPCAKSRLKELRRVVLTPAEAPEGLTALYRQQVGDYPKFFKMDPLCKLGFLAAEQLLAGEAEEPGLDPTEERAIVLFSRQGSMADDRAYEETISNPEEYFPSPSVFVYTLSNIVTGELAIRHNCHGESSCYILEEKDWTLMEQILATTLQDSGIRSVVGGWVDFEDDQHYEADLRLYSKTT